MAIKIEKKAGILYKSAKRLRAAIFAGLIVGAVFIGMISITPKVGAQLVYFEDDMESGPSGWVAEGFWHLVNDSSPYSNNHSTEHSWWYGNESTGTYENGTANWGNLTSPVIDLTTATIANLTFWTWYETEDPTEEGPIFDQMWVQISEDGGPFLGEYQINPVIMGEWIKISLNITFHVGHNIQVRFLFDTLEEMFNDYRGWYIDDVEVNDIPVPPPPSFEPPHSDDGLDTDGDGYYNHLVINVTVNVSVAGYYEIRGVLKDNLGYWVDGESNFTFLSPGIQTVELCFDARLIYNNGVNGSYNVTLELWDDIGNLLDNDTYITDFYRWDKFQPPPAMFEPPHSDYGLDTDDDGYFGYLVVNVTVNVSVAGNYEVSGALFDSFFNWSGDAFLDIGIHILELRFDGWIIDNKSEDGPYIVELKLYNYSFDLLDSDTYTTKFYTHDQFQPSEHPNSNNGSDGQQPDTTPPTVVSVSLNGTDVEVTKTLTITFSEAMNHTSVENSITISPYVSISDYSWEDNASTITFTSKLKYDTEYNVTIGTVAKDLAGNALEEPYSWRFTTKAEPGQGELGQGLLPLFLLLIPIVIILIMALLAWSSKRGKSEESEELPQEEPDEEIGEEGEEELEEEVEEGEEEEVEEEPEEEEEIEEEETEEEPEEAGEEGEELEEGGEGEAEESEEETGENEEEEPKEVVDEST